MTERPEGTPAQEPAEPEAPPNAETESGAPAAEAGAIEELEGEAGAFDAETDEAEADETDAELEADEAATDELGADDLEDETVVSLGVEPAATLVAPGGAAAAPRRRDTPQASVQRAPTQSELAVRVTDNASRFFVIGTVVVFVAILLYAMLAGSGGLLTSKPSPGVEPSGSAQPSASASAGASSPAAPSVSAAPSEPAASTSPS